MRGAERSCHPLKSQEAAEALDAALLQEGKLCILFPFLHSLAGACLLWQYFLQKRSHYQIGHVRIDLQLRTRSCHYERRYPLCAPPLCCTSSPTNPLALSQYLHAAPLPGAWTERSRHKKWRIVRDERQLKRCAAVPFHGDVCQSRTVMTYNITAILHALNPG